MAAYLLKLSAAQGLAEAQVKLAYLYRHGMGGVEHDIEAAQKLFAMAAEQGHAEAQEQLQQVTSHIDKCTRSPVGGRRLSTAGAPCGLRRAHRAAETSVGVCSPMRWAYQLNTLGYVYQPKSGTRHSEIDDIRQGVRQSVVKFATV